MTYRIFNGYQMTFQDLPSLEHPTMQLTDLMDANGKPIWECDIVTRGTRKGVVEYDQELERFSVRFGTELVPLYDGESFTVVGNAFEHYIKL